MRKIANSEIPSQCANRSISTSKPHGPTQNINNISNRYKLEMFKIKHFPWEI